MAPYGYSSASAFERDLHDFLRIHAWANGGAVRTFANIHRDMHLSEGGTAADYKPPELMFFHLRPNPNSQNPATRFSVLEQSFEDLEEHTRTDKCWWDHTASRRDELRRQHGDKPDFAGILAVMYTVAGVRTMSMEFFPVWKASPCEFTLEQRMPMMLDMVDFCAASINRDFPLRCTNGEQVIPVPGRYVRSEGRTWLWEPLFTDWESYQGGHQALDFVLSNMRIGLSVPLLTTVCVSL